MYDYRRILIHPDPRLLTPAIPVDDEFVGSGALFRIIAALKMHLAQARSGIGIAANQIGGDRRVAVISLLSEEYMMVNPEITKRRGKVRSFEQCLSVRDEDDLEIGEEELAMTGYYVERPKAITVRFTEPVMTSPNTMEMQERTVKCAGLLAACVCHEVDHLDGITIVERGKEEAA